MVLRGQRGAVRARTLEELQEMLDRPWSPDEVDARESVGASEHGTSREEREVRKVAGEFRRQRGNQRGAFRGGRGEGRGKGRPGRNERESGGRGGEGGEERPRGPGGIGGPRRRRRPR